MKLLTPSRLRDIAFVLIISLAGVGLAAIEPGPRIRKIEAHSKLERLLVELDSRHRQVVDFGPPEFMHELSWGGAVTYEMYYKEMRGYDDFIGKWCPESFIVYRNGDGILHRLNYCPIGYGADSVDITSGDKCIKAFNQFVQEIDLEGRLPRDVEARMFVTLSCHKNPGDYPEFLLMRNDVGGRASNLSADQKHCLALMSRKGLLKKGRYFLVAVYAAEYAKSYTDKPVSAEWWHPWICYEFSFTQSGEISAVHATLLNRPGYSS